MGLHNICRHEQPHSLYSVSIRNEYHQRSAEIDQPCRNLYTTKRLSAVELHYAAGSAIAVVSNPRAVDMIRLLVETRPLTGEIPFSLILKGLDCTMPQISLVSCDVSARMGSCIPKISSCIPGKSEDSSLRGGKEAGGMTRTARTRPISSELSQSHGKNTHGRRRLHGWLERLKSR